MEVFLKQGVAKKTQSGYPTNKYLEQVGWGTRLEDQSEYASDNQVEMVCSVVARWVGKPIYLLTVCVTQFNSDPISTTATSSKDQPSNKCDPGSVL